MINCILYTNVISPLDTARHRKPQSLTMAVHVHEAGDAPSAEVCALRAAPRMGHMNNDTPPRMKHMRSTIWTVRMI